MSKGKVQAEHAKQLLELAHKMVGQKAGGNPFIKKGASKSHLFQKGHNNNPFKARLDGNKFGQESSEDPKKHKSEGKQGETQEHGNES